MSKFVTSWVFAVAVYYCKGVVTLATFYEQKRSIVSSVEMCEAQPTQKSPSNQEKVTFLKPENFLLVNVANSCEEFVKSVCGNLLLSPGFLLK